ncbi:MAG TPA: type II toxin-antitoxin system PrlF family antitoxin [Thermoanaerobaculia bacterium]|nr:type II toxin-antitoxin system PrlF family antitoxin [Thermoanaerobaculia bacterium]
MAKATMTSKGQVTVPKEIRDHLGLESGDRLSFEIREGGEVVIEAETADISELKGLLPPPRKAISIEQMDAAIRKGATRKR